MLEFLWQYFYTMKGIPITVFTAIAGLLCAIVIADARKGMAAVSKASDDYSIFEWRVWTGTHVGFIVGVLWLLIMAVPEPNFKREIVYQPKVVEKKVPVHVYKGVKVQYHTPTYPEAFKLCTDAIRGGTIADDVKLCHRQATEASMPPYRRITRTIREPSNFWDTFKSCNDAYDIGQNKPGWFERRQARMQVCKTVALDASRG
jgi:hypothetical protein